MRKYNEPQVLQARSGPVFMVDNKDGSKTSLHAVMEVKAVDNKVQKTPAACLGATCAGCDDTQADLMDPDCAGQPY